MVSCFAKILICLNLCLPTVIGYLVFLKQISCSWLYVFKYSSHILIT